jgi:hypothetical protein
MADLAREEVTAHTARAEAHNPCSDGCGLSSAECAELHSWLVAYVLARLTERQFAQREKHVWQEAA